MPPGKTGRLHRAARSGDLVKAKEYFKPSALRKKVLNVDKPDEHGSTPLMIATFEGHVEIVRFLLAQKADVNKQNENGVCALMAAANNGKTELVEILCAQPFNQNLINCDGYTAALIAAEKGHTKILVILHAHKVRIATDSLANGANALLLSCSGGYLDTAKFCLSLGIDVNKPMKEGITALMLAATHQHVDVVEWLIENGADPNKKASDGRTAFRMCVDMELSDMAEELRKLGVDSSFNTGLFQSANLMKWWYVFTPCIVFGSNLQLMDQDCCCWCCLYCFSCLGTPIVPCCIAARFRSIIRGRYEISGSRCGDIATHMCCHCCALTQERDMLKNNPWKGERARAPTVTTPEDMGVYHRMK